MDPNPPTNRTLYHVKPYGYIRTDSLDQSIEERRLWSSILVAGEKNDPRSTRGEFEGLAFNLGSPQPPSRDGTDGAVRRGAAQGSPSR